jgi:hypothetical protein
VVSSWTAGELVGAAVEALVGAGVAALVQAEKMTPNTTVAAKNLDLIDIVPPRNLLRNAELTACNRMPSRSAKTLAT